MAIITQILTFVLIISILVILHEFGHYLPAKWFKTRVEKFYLFFDWKYSLFKKKIGETEWGIGWLPLGGYVKIAGMVDESMDTEQLEAEPQPWEFRSKPAWQRLIIMLGGVTVNFLLAWLIYSSLFAINGDNYIPADNVKYGILVDSVGEKIGLRTGDKIVAIDGKKTKKFDDAMIDIILGDEVTVNRDGNEVTFPIPEEGIADVLGLRGKRFLDYRLKPIIDSLSKETPAFNSGIKKGDIIVQFENHKIEYWDEFRTAVQNNKKDSVTLTVDREGSLKAFKLKLDKDGRVGVWIDREDISVTDEYTIAQSIPAGFTETINVLVKQVKQFKILAKPKTKAYKSIKGPIGIVEMMPAKWNWGFFWNFLAMFSVWLAFVNILPIPALDGGHVMFLLYEMISGRPPSQKVLETGQIIGFVFLMLLMAIIFGNDIWNIVKRFIE